MDDWVVFVNVGQLFFVVEHQQIALEVVAVVVEDKVLFVA
jgi:hypothetical protein